MFTKKKHDFGRPGSRDGAEAVLALVVGSLLGGGVSGGDSVHGLTGDAVILELDPEQVIYRYAAMSSFPAHMHAIRALAGRQWLGN